MSSNIGRPVKELPLFPFCYKMWKDGRWTRNICCVILGTASKPIGLSTFRRRCEDFALNSEDEQQRLILESAKLYQELQIEKELLAKIQRSDEEAWQKYEADVLDYNDRQARILLESTKANFLANRSYDRFVEENGLNVQESDEELFKDEFEET